LLPKYCHSFHFCSRCDVFTTFKFYSVSNYSVAEIWRILEQFQATLLKNDYAISPTAVDVTVPWSVCMSVCLSVTFVHCAQTAEVIDTISFAYDSPISLLDRLKIWLTSVNPFLLKYDRRYRQAVCCAAYHYERSNVVFCQITWPLLNYFLAKRTQTYSVQR